MPRGTETITVVGGYDPEDVDWQGDPKPGAVPNDDRDLTGCITSDVSTQDRPDVVLDSKYVFLPVGNIPPEPHDALLYEGAEWSIDGNVATRRKPNGRLLGWDFSMRKVT